MANKKARTKAAIVKRLSEVRIVEIACKSVGISRATYYRWLKEDPQFEWDCEDAIRQGTAVICDLAESQIVAKIRGGDFRASTYFLEKHHKDYKPKPRPKSEPEPEEWDPWKNVSFTEKEMEYIFKVGQQLQEEKLNEKKKGGDV